MNAFLIATVTETRARAEELRQELHPLLRRAAERDAYPFVLFEGPLRALLPKATTGPKA